MHNTSTVRYNLKIIQRWGVRKIKNNQTRFFARFELGHSTVQYSTVEEDNTVGVVRRFMIRLRINGLI
jgi:hypothetical protein